jgi:hypothetical protein
MLGVQMSSQLLNGIPLLGDDVANRRIICVVRLKGYELIGVGDGEHIIPPVRGWEHGPKRLVKIEAVANSGALVERNEFPIPCNKCVHSSLHRWQQRTRLHEDGC